MPHRLSVSYIRSIISAGHWQFLMLGLIFLLLLLYLTQTNSQAAQTFAIRKLELSQQSLNEDIRNLTWEISAGRSLAAVSERAAALRLARPAEVSFVAGGESAVALSNVTAP